MSFGRKPAKTELIRRMQVATRHIKTELRFELSKIDQGSREPVHIEPPKYALHLITVDGEHQDGDGG